MIALPLLLLAAAAACARPGTEGPPADPGVKAGLKAEFEVVSGKTFVEFEPGSAKLSPAAKFRLERQALWLQAYPQFTFRVVAAGDGAGGEKDLRLAARRGDAVRRYFAEIGVGPDRISRVEPAAARGELRARAMSLVDGL